MTSKRIATGGVLAHHARREILALLDDLDATYGAPTADVIAEVDGEAEAIFGRSSRASAKARARSKRAPSTGTKALRTR